MQTLIPSGNQLAAAGLSVLQALPALCSLELWAPLKLDELVRVSGLPKLRRVRLRFLHGDSPNPGDDAYASLARLPLLEEIDVSGSQPSPSDLSATFATDGKPLSSTSDADQTLVYLVEHEFGRVEMLRPSKFQALATER